MRRISRRDLLFSTVALSGTHPIITGSHAPFLSGGSVAGPTLTAQTVDTQQVFHRNGASTGNPPGYSTTYGLGYGTFKVALGCATAVSGIMLVFRLRDASSPLTIIQAFTALPGAPTSLISGTNNFSINIPASPKFYLMDIAFSTDTGHAVTVTNAFACGFLIAFAGQSIAARMPLATSGTATQIATYVPGASPIGYVYAPYTNNPAATGVVTTTWALPVDGGTYGSAFAAEIMRVMVAQLGVVCALIGHAVDGTSITTFDPVSPTLGTNWIILEKVLNRGYGNIGAFIWCQGNADDSGGMTRQQYLARLQTIMSAIRAGSSSTVYGLIAPVTAQEGGEPAPYYSGVLQYACLDLVASDPLSVFIGCLDAGPTADGGHIASGGRVPWAYDIYRPLMGLLGQFALNQGPTPATTGTRASGSRTCVFNVAPDGGTSLLATLATVPGASPVPTSTLSTIANQFQIFAAGDTTTPLALDPTTPIGVISATQMSVSLASLPAGGDAAGLDVRYRYGPSPTAIAWGNALRDNVTNSDGITYGRQAQIIIGATYIPAPVPAATTMTMTTIQGQSAAGTAVVAAGETIAISGTNTGNRLTAGLNTNLDGAGFVGAAAPVIGNGGTWTALIVAPSAGSHTIQVQDPTSGAVTSTITFTTTTAAASLPVAGCVAMFDACQLGLMWQNVAKTIPAAPSQPLRYYSDATGTASNDLLQAGTTYPILSPSTRNNLPMVDFANDPIGSGVGSTLSSGTSPALGALAAADITILGVWTEQTLRNPESVFGISRNDNAAPNNGAYLSVNAAGGKPVFTRFSESSTFANAATLVVYGHTPNLIKAVARFEVATGITKLLVAGGTEASATLTGGAGASWNQVSMGKVFGGSPFQGSQMQIIVFNRLLTDTERDTMLAWATTKWGS